jgi:hypothetical protein
MLKYRPKYDCNIDRSSLSYVNLFRSLNEGKYEIKYINQPDAEISRVYFLTFIYSSTFFGCPHAHQQELNNCSSSLWFYRWSVVIEVLLFVVGPVGPTTNNSTAITTVKPGAATAVVELLMMGVRKPETC